MNPLREFIALTLKESKRKTFSIDELRTLNDLDDVLNYAGSRLKFLGEGEARAVYELSSTRVLKVAKQKEKMGGPWQNEIEVKVFIDYLVKPIIARIYDYDLAMKWIVAEKVKPLNDRKIMRSLGYKGNYNDACEKFLQLWDFYGLFGLLVDPDSEAREDLWDEFNDVASNDQFKTIVDGIQILKDRYHLQVGDLIRPEHWGLTSAGRIVIYDYGCT